MKNCQKKEHSNNFYTIVFMFFIFVWLSYFNKCYPDMIRCSSVIIHHSMRFICLFYFFNILNGSFNTFGLYTSFLAADHLNRCLWSNTNLAITLTGILFIFLIYLFKVYNFFIGARMSSKYISSNKKKKIPPAYKEPSAEIRAAGMVTQRYAVHKGSPGSKLYSSLRTGAY